MGPLSPAAQKQEKTWRKDRVKPFIDPRLVDRSYNPVVDDWVDDNNPRWKALQHTYNRPGPFFIGRCVSTKNPKTAMIEVPYWIPSKRVGKQMPLRYTTRFMAHDEDQICELNDIVEIRHSRKYSKRKFTVVTRILKKDPGNAFLKEHPEFAIVRSRLDMRKKIEQIREEELNAAFLMPKKKDKAAQDNTSTPS